MATAVAVLNSFGSDSWKADAYESLSLAARLSIAVKSVKSRGQHIKLSYLLWRINSISGKFLTDVDDILTGKKTPSSPPATATPDDYKSSIDTLIQLGNSFMSVYEEARRKRLLNNSLIAGPITALRSHADQFFELAEWFELVNAPDEIQRIFADAHAEKSRGEIFDLSQV